ncbi:MAG: redox-regulated ATPase YchF [bacterium]|nr:redox-regulated ATPase YchF [bacterium]
MALRIGIVGLPNVGKSTTFNALTKAQNAEAANYPFCTIEPNKAIVPVPDERLEKLAEIVNPKQIIHSTVEFVDIAGLVKGASQGEGLGNQFLGNIRETEAIVHIVRCFDDENVVHVNGQCDPAGDIEVITTELILADLQSLDKKISRLERQAKADKSLAPVMSAASALKTHFEAGEPASSFSQKENDAYEELDRELRFLTGKTVIYVANVDEDGLAEDNAYVEAVRAIAAKEDAEVVKLCAKFEEEMAGLSDEERVEFLETMNVSEDGLHKVIHKGYHALGLMSYFTAGPKEVRAWTIHKGWTAPKAAGVIHNDFERGFIRAEVISYDDYIQYKGETGAKAAGRMRLEGKEYVMQDGDVVLFRFSV